MSGRGVRELVSTKVSPHPPSLPPSLPPSSLPPYLVPRLDNDDVAHHNVVHRDRLHVPIAPDLKGGGGEGGREGGKEGRGHQEGTTNGQR